MLILLPPSEGKTAPPSGPVIDLASLSFPSLSGTRKRVLSSLVALCRGKRDVAQATLGLGPTQRGEVASNARLRRQPCAAAISVYTGVLYEALDYPSLSEAARRRADEQIAISSALWGLVRPGDAIPAYRLSGAVSLPGVGTVASAWRAPVTAVLDRSEGLIVDLRSSTYASLGPLSRTAAPRSVSVRVLQERDGRRVVVSHSNKATKGRIVRALLANSQVPDSVDDFIHRLDLSGFRVESAAGAPGKAALVDVIVDEP